MSIDIDNGKCHMHCEMSAESFTLTRHIQGNHVALVNDAAALAGTDLITRSE